jgi:hypothetical protein
MFTVSAGAQLATEPETTLDGKFYLTSAAPVVLVIPMDYKKEKDRLRKQMEALEEQWRAEVESAKAAANERRLELQVAALEEAEKKKRDRQDARIERDRERMSSLLDNRRKAACKWALWNYPGHFHNRTAHGILAVQLRAHKVGWTVEQLIEATLVFRKEVILATAMGGPQPAIVPRAVNADLEISSEPALSDDLAALKALEDAREAALEADMEYSNAAMDAEKAAVGK